MKTTVQKQQLKQHDEGVTKMSPSLTGEKKASLCVMQEAKL